MLRGTPPGPCYDAPATGERAGSVAAIQLAAIPCRLARIKAEALNAGNVYVGTSSAVTRAAGTTTTTCGFQLAAGDDTGWIPIDNLNRLWIICDNAGDAITYMVMD